MGLRYRQVLWVSSLARSFLADGSCVLTSRFRAKHSGVSNPSLFLSYGGIR